MNESHKVSLQLKYARYKRVPNILFHLHKVQKQAKLIYDNRVQKTYMSSASFPTKFLSEIDI